MKPVDEIQERAAACLRAMQVATDPGLKSMFSELHQRWSSAADSHRLQTHTSAAK